jgi:hypothetical protein
LNSIRTYTNSDQDIAFDNGVIHIIDGLLTIPPNVSVTAQEAGLSAFLGAVNVTNLTEAGHQLCLEQPHG